MALLHQHPALSACLLLATLLVAASPATAAVTGASRAAFLADVRARASAAASSRAPGPTDVSPADASRVLKEAFAAEASRKAVLRRERLGAGADVIANTSYGALVGVGDGVVNQWLGVPFAAPPVGPLRWRAPAPLAPWAPARRNATWFAPTCMQSEWCE